MIEPLIQCLNARDDLTADELDFLRSLPMRPRAFARGATLVEAYSSSTDCCLLISGVCARALDRPDGSRQITALHFAGDIPDLHSFLLKQIDHSVVAMTDCVVTYIPHRLFTGMTETMPHLTRMFWVLLAVDAAIQRAWIASKGHRSALQHLAHLLCEVYLRLRTTGLANDNRFRFEFTQRDLGDCLGLSSVHVNRSMQTLRAQKLVDWGKHEIVISDWEGLLEAADFDGTYLNLMRRPR